MEAQVSTWIAVAALAVSTMGGIAMAAITMWGKRLETSAAVEVALLKAKVEHQATQIEECNMDRADLRKRIEAIEAGQR